MIVHKTDVTREEVIRAYARYDLRKKQRAHLVSTSAFDAWKSDDPDEIERHLEAAGLKARVLAAYLTWKFVKFSVADLLECAVVNHIFPNEPQAICRLVLRGKLAEWFPQGTPEWWRQLGGGSEPDVDAILIVRPAVATERPAKWYLEDGSGRGLALVQRALRYGELDRTAWAYVGDTPDEGSRFMREHRELKDVRL